MRKIILSLSLCLSVAVAVAQEQPATNSYLPVAGDYALGVDATPFLKYAGNFFSQSGSNSAPEFKGFRGQGIYGKYFLKDNRAIRAKLLLDMYTKSYKQSVPNDEAISATPDATTIDTKKEGTTAVGLSVGYEFRRGHGRVQGFWGGELALGLGSASDTYEYGNPMTAANANPTTTFGSSSTRVLESKGGLSFTGGLRGFVGVEYFIANQVSLGGEFTLGLDAFIRGQSEVTTQEVVNGEVREATVRARDMSDVASTFGLKTVTSGNIFLMFYF
ncbi:MAG: outer membrane beta-barrel protein [Prevotellaceae bacterium]|jgi:hypothetical protein|nr:outer membrane beta-barrel protein [Prevotellaceae bacterium]